MKLELDFNKVLIQNRNPKTKIPHSKLENATKASIYFYTEKQRSKLFDYVTDEFLLSQKTRKEVAKTIGRSEKTVTNWFANPQSFTFEKACELLLGIRGRIDIYFGNIEMKFVSEKDNRPMELLYG